MNLWYPYWLYLIKSYKIYVFVSANFIPTRGAPCDHADVYLLYSEWYSIYEVFDVIQVIQL